MFLSARFRVCLMDTILDVCANIINIVEDKYDEITTSIEITNSPTDIKLEYKSDCEEIGGEEGSATQCSRVELGTPVTFSVILTTDHCPAEEEENITISTLGLPGGLTLLIESGCKCDCSEQGKLTVYRYRLGLGPVKF